MIIGGVNITKEQEGLKEVVIDGRRGLAGYVFPDQDIVKVVFDDGGCEFHQDLPTAKE
jgi:hypothetical protein